MYICVKVSDTANIAFFFFDELLNKRFLRNFSLSHTHTYKKEPLLLLFPSLPRPHAVLFIKLLFDNGMESRARLDPVNLTVIPRGKFVSL